MPLSEMRSHTRWCTVFLVVLLLASIIPIRSPVEVEARPYVPPPEPDPYVPGEVIVKYKAGVEPAVQSMSVSSLGFNKEETLSAARRMELLRLPSGTSVSSAIRQLECLDTVEYAQPNYLLSSFIVGPDDPLFGYQWGLFDLDVLNAWNLLGDPLPASEVIVAVIDTGVDINHPDLAANIWTNPNDPVNGVDDDGNGLVDDVHGWDFYWGDNTVYDPEDGDDHGTHVAGIVAARCDNGIGVAGVAPQVSILPVKFLGPSGSGSTSDAISAIEYATQQGARIINASWGGGPFNQALSDAIEAFGQAGGIFVASAGNKASDNDQCPVYPASYDLPNVISVAAMDQYGDLAYFSNYGAESVDVGAPGLDIISTVPGWSAALAVSDGYRAMVWGFGAEDFTDAGTCEDAIGRALGFLGLNPGDTLLLVDDDQDDHGAPDVENVYLDAVCSLGYSAGIFDVSVQEATYGLSGPESVTMATYDGVLWFTGSAYDPYPLTDDNLAELTSYLDGGGRLFLSGADALYGNEISTLVETYFHARWQSEWPAVRHDGLWGLADPYSPAEVVTYATYWSSDGYNDFLSAADDYATEVLCYEQYQYSWMSGTSMAAPHVSGAAALLLSLDPGASPQDVISAILNTTTPLPSLTGKTVSGGMVNANDALIYLDAGPRVQLTPTTVEALEGGSGGSYTITLNTAPAHDVTITAQADGQVLVDGGSSTTLTFTPVDWDQPQTVAVTAVDDDLVEGKHEGVIGHVVSSTDPDYDNAAVNNVTVNLTDNDPGVQFSSDDGFMTVEEGGTDTYFVVLTGEPAGEVTVTALPQEQLAVDNGGGGASLVFGPANWQIPQAMQVTAVEDLEVEGLHFAAISHSVSSADPGYDGIATEDMEYVIMDNDPGLVAYRLFDSSYVSEGGATDSVVFGLSTIPDADVTVTLSCDDQVAVDQTILTFLADQFYSETIIVSAVDDEAVEGDHMGYITCQAASADPDYDGTSLVMDVHIGDNDEYSPPPPSGGGSAPPPSQPADTPPPSAQPVEPDADTSITFGGTGVTVDLPAGVAETEEGEELFLTVTVVEPEDESVPPPPDHHQTTGLCLDIDLTRYGDGDSDEVHELQKPITLVIDVSLLDLSGEDPERIGLYLYDEEAGCWMYVESRYDPVSGKLIATLEHLSRFAVMVSTRSFSDVAGHWARSAVETLAGRGIVAGVGPSEFMPDRAVTRAEFCVLLARCLRLPIVLPDPSSNPFADVPANSWYTGSVWGAYQAGLVQGVSEITFAPEQPITRQEMAVLLSRALARRGVRTGLSASQMGSLLDSFTDSVHIAGWAREGMAQAVHSGIMQGRDTSILAPAGTATRAETAVMLKRFLDLTSSVPVIIKGRLQTNDIEGYHYELLAGDGSLYLLLLDGKTHLAASLRSQVGREVSLYGRPDSGTITIYQRGTPFRVEGLLH